MKAVRIHDRGGPEQLRYEDAPPPALSPGDALVRVRALGITPSELGWSATYTTKDGRDRLPSIPGHELSGVVEQVAPGVTGVKRGDEVYALTDFWRDGTAAELVAVQAEDLAPKPTTLEHAQAATVPLSALTAWQALFDHAALEPGQRILIHGGSGGVGTYAVQLAHRRGAYVVATARAPDAGLLGDLGADEVIDWTSTRFEVVARDLDIVLDTVGGETVDRSWKTLTRGGVLVSIVSDSFGDAESKYGVRGRFFIVKPDREQLVEIGRRIDAGELVPISEATFPLEDMGAAYERTMHDHHRGKSALRVGPDR